VRYCASMNQSGVAVADHHQFVLGSLTAETYEPSKTGSVIEVGQNFVTVMTGIAYGLVALSLEVLDDEPAFHADRCAWEIVEEATVKVTKSFHVITWSGEKLPGFARLAIDRGSYRFRVSGRDRDKQWTLDHLGYATRIVVLIASIVRVIDDLRVSSGGHLTACSASITRTVPDLLRITID
jgi:hypothetical protein